MTPDVDFGLAELRLSPPGSPTIDITVPPREFRADGTCLARLFLDQAARTGLFRALEEAGAAPRSDAKLRNWVDNGWEESLRWYAASRAVEFADGSDRAGVARERAISEYRRTGDGAPAPWPMPAERHELPAPVPVDPRAVIDGLLSRRSVRRYHGSICAADLTGVVINAWRIGGLSVRDDAATELDYFRGAPGVYSLAAWVFDVEGMAPGVYRLHYDGRSVTASLLHEGVPREQMRAVLQGLAAPLTASATIVLLGDLRRYSWIYRHEHALRSMYITAGRFGQGGVAAAAALGLGSLVTPATRDALVAQVLGTPPDVVPIYTLTLGRAARAGAKEPADE